MLCADSSTQTLIPQISTEYFTFTIIRLRLRAGILIQHQDINKVDLAIFDLDNTLLAGDSDYLWGQFLGENGYVDAEAHQKENDRYYKDYLEGNLDINAFLEFQFLPLAENDMQTILGWRTRFLDEKILPVMLPKATQLVEDHRNMGHKLLIITATNSFITSPIVDLFNIDALIAAEPEMINGEFTGKLSGTPSFAEGKVTRYEQWLQENNFEAATSWFYSDSHNDIPLLNKVTHPIAVDPDDALIAEAEKRDWPIISLR
jgi:HAD superfamily hydrolase (TIGR01490 family)